MTGCDTEFSKPSYKYSFVLFFYNNTYSCDESGIIFILCPLSPGLHASKKYN